MTNSDITTSQIEALRDEAHLAGDYKMLYTCELALDDDPDALERCAAAIAGAQAMQPRGD